MKAQISQCANCQAETSIEDSFCQDCGLALDHEHASIRSPMVDVGRLHPGVAKPVIALPLIVVVILALILVPMFLIGFERSYSNFSNQYVTDQALAAYKENRLDEGAVVLERLALTHKLNDEQRNLLDDIYLARAEQRASRLDYTSAIADLNRTSPQYAKSIVVSSKRLDFIQLLKQQQQKADAIAAGSRNHANGSERSKTASRKNSSVSRDSSPSVNLPATTVAQNQIDKRIPPTLSTEHKEADSTDLAGSTNARLNSSIERNMLVQNPVPPHAMPAVINSIPNSKITPASGQNSSPRQLSAATQAQTLSSNNSSSVSRADTVAEKTVDRAKSAKASKGNENDMVRYNELLAGYFSQERKHSSSLNEPPSFKEWLEQNRPNF